MQKVLFIDRDGTLVIEPPIDKQLDSLEKLEFYPGVFRWLSKISEELDYQFVMVTNQDGLGTESFLEDSFWPAQNKVIQSLQNEGIVFEEILIDRSRPEDKANTRKPNTGMLQKYLYGQYDLAQSFVIGDRASDIELATNLGAQGISLGNQNEQAALNTNSWKEIYQFLKDKPRTAQLTRATSETSIRIDLSLDGNGYSDIETGIGFFDHMLDQIAKHGNLDLRMKVDGDLNVDEHHTIEDVALALGETVDKALGIRKGINRYGFLLPMDDCLAQVALDFGGRPWFEWKASFSREKIGGMPTEMFSHFFKSFTDKARCNLNIKAEGVNEHHKIESIFKAFAKALRMAVKKNNSSTIPSTKGIL